MARSKVVVLGGGVAGTVLANRLVRSKAPVDVTLIDGHGTHLFQPAFIDVALGDRRAKDVEHDERSLLDRRVRLVVGRATAIRRDERRVRIETGEEFPFDALAIASGATPDARAIEGFREGAFHFHCRRRAAALAQELDCFSGGRIVVGASALPYKCPPSVLSFALLFEERLRRTNRRAATEITYIYPVEGVQPSAAASRAFAPLLEERGIRVVSPFPIAAIDPGARRVLSKNGRALEYDLLVLAPPHRGPGFLRGSGLCAPEGFVRVDPETMRAAPGIYALGDAADVRRPGEDPVPKSGAAARAQAAVVARNIAAEASLREAAARYNGGAICLAATGGGRAVRIDLEYGKPPCIYPPRRAHYWTMALVDRLYFRLIGRI
jgi:sulfide:quinone oxidoreductase